jgi:hypothetical protein
MQGVAQAVLGAVGVIGLAGSGHAYEFDTGSEAKLRWDNSLKYTVAWRLLNQSSKIVNGDPGAPARDLDDGDRNFKKGGLMTNRVDWFSALDASYKNLGFRISGVAWHDQVYLDSNANTTQATVNTLSVPAGQFDQGTKDLMGQKAELLEAFLSVKSDPDSKTPYIVRAGKHTLLYGETLFFGANGINYAQSPMDVIKLLLVPFSQAVEIHRPVEQLSTQVQLSGNVSVGAYYQFKWEATRLPAYGSYLSVVDFAGAGAESYAGMTRVGDVQGKNSGQGGVQVRFKPGDRTLEYALYAAQYNDKNLQKMLSPAYIPGGMNAYRLVYADDVKTFGGGFNTVFGASRVTGEVSMRTNAPLQSAAQIDIALTGNGSTNPLYAVGRSAHANISGNAEIGKSPIWDSARFLIELGWNRRLSIEKNPLALDPNVTRDALALRMVFTPKYFQVSRDVDLSVPIGLGYNPYGRSSTVLAFNGGADHGGDLSIGVTADIRKQYKVGISYVHYFGPQNAMLTANTNTAIPGRYMQTGAQALGDRDFITLSFQAKF